MSRANKLDAPLKGPIITEYCQPRDLRKLAVMIVTQAIKDLGKQNDAVRSVGSLLWLTDPRSDFSLYLETADMAHLDIFNLITSGNARKLRGKA